MATGDVGRLRLIRDEKTGARMSQWGFEAGGAGKGEKSANPGVGQ